MLISIIIPCYNVAEYITECVNSCYSQTYKNIEVICVDNNSKDSTLHKLKLLKNDHPQMIIEIENRKGAPFARNKGLKLAKGEWIQFLDADDLLLPTKLEHQAKLVQKDSSFIAGACIKKDINGLERVISPNTTDVFKALFNGNLGNTCSNLWRKSSIIAIQYCNVELKSSQEADLMYRLLQNNTKVIYDILPLTIIRERESGQIGQRNPSLKWQQLFYVRLKILDWIKCCYTEYYTINETWYKDALFGILRILAEHDLPIANKLFLKYLGKKYKPSNELSHSTKAYLILFNIFGFKKTEAQRMIINKFR